jgi:hypothetical protein
VVAGDTQVVTGSGFEPGEEVTVLFGGTVLGQVNANSEGNVTYQFTVPKDLAAGTYKVVLRGASSGSVEGTFAVTQPVLEFTGTAAGQLTVAAPLALGLGGAMIGVGRRRRRAQLV